jgi:hypothetical protein
MEPRRVVNIRIYDKEEPPIIAQCISCVHAVTQVFDPENCSERLAVATTHLACSLGNDCWCEKKCNDFVEGTPRQATLIPISAS